MQLKSSLYAPLGVVLSLLVGCQDLALSTHRADVDNCPDHDCGPPDDPPDDPPPEDPPPQPDPAKFREKVIPIEFVRSRLDQLLGGTKVQLSHLDGDDLEFHGVGEVCHTQSNPDVEDCLAGCEELPPRAKLACRAACRATTTTCEDVCSSWQSKSWLRWGNAALAASVLSSPRSCDATTCPACNPAQTVPSLEHRPLPLPVFDKSYTVGPFTYQFTCRVNRWVFQIGGNLTLQASPSGLTIAVPGATGDPAVVCDNAPDATVDHLAVQIRFIFPTSGLAISAEGTLLGDWHLFGSPIDFLADLNGHVSSAVRSASTDALNTTGARAAYRRAFTTLANNYIEEVTHEQLDILGNFTPVNGGLRMRYWVK